MTSPGFLPTRQLVLVDLLAMMCATAPGERALVAVDGATGRRHERWNFDEVSGRELRGGNAHEADVKIDRTLSARLTVGGGLAGGSVAAKVVPSIMARPRSCFEVPGLATG
mgnify:CR=1 FL=1